MAWYDRRVRRVRDLSCGDTRIFLELEVRRLDCRHCGKVKSERLEFLADNPLYTKRFAYYVGHRCRSATIKDVAAELKLDWHTVKALDQQYMEAQLKRTGTPSPQVIGVDEIAIRKGHTYRIVVSDLLRGRPIWFGGKDRSEASMGEFYAWLGKKNSARIRLAVMDMARLWIKSARVNMGGLRGAIGATSRVRNTHCCRARRTSHSMARGH
jgi:transposase